MDTEHVFDDLHSIFYTILRRDNFILSDNTTAKDIEGWDSLSNMLIITEIEKKYNIRFSFREIVKMKNVGDLCQAIRNKTT